MPEVALCACGCGKLTNPGRLWVHGHNSRKMPVWHPEDRDYSTPCWIWDRPPRSKKGGAYGVIRRHGRNFPAHRWLYEEVFGPVPAGLELDHLCRVPACVNPDHLEPVTHIENVMRSNALPALNAKKTHCKRGHEFTPENTMYQGTWRRCRTCHNAATNAAHHAKVGSRDR